MRRLHEVVPCRSVCVAVFEEGGKTAKVRINRQGAENVVESQTCELAGDELEALASGAPHWFLDADDRPPGYLASLTDTDTRRILVLPVVLKDGPAAIIAIGMDDESDCTEEDIARVREVADRTAVALSNVAWEEKLYHQAHYDARIASCCVIDSSRL